jgi:hypothetical protein
MKSNHLVSLQLERRFVNELVTFLTETIEPWEITRDHVEGDDAPDDVLLCACNSEEEAQGFVDYYRRVRDRITAQLVTVDAHDP